MKLVVTIPYTIYGVPVDAQTRVSLAANQTRRLGYSTNPHRRRLVRQAEEQLRHDAAIATLYAMQGATERRPTRPFHDVTPIRVEILVSIKTARTRDADGCIAGLKIGFDAIAQALGVDDSRFQMGEVTFVKGDPETRLTLEA